MAGFNLPPLDAPIPTSTKPSPKPEVKGFGRETLIPIEVEDRIFDELDSTKKDNSKVDIDDIFSDLDFPASQQANPKQSTPSVAPAFKPPALGEDVDDLEDLEDIEEEDGLGLYDLKSGPTSAALGGEEDDLVWLSLQVLGKLCDVSRNERGCLALDEGETSVGGAEGDRGKLG